MMRKILPQPSLTIVLTVVWLLFLHRFDLGGLLLALAVGVIVPLMTDRFWPDRPRLKLSWDVIVYVLIVLWDIVPACFQMAGVVLFKRNDQLRSAWLVVPLDLRTPEAVALMAGTISITPGTVACDISADGRALLVHALDTADPEADVRRIKTRYEARLQRIFS